MFESARVSWLYARACRNNRTGDLDAALAEVQKSFTLMQRVAPRAEWLFTPSILISKFFYVLEQKLGRAGLAAPAVRLALGVWDDHTSRHPELKEMVGMPEWEAWARGYIANPPSEPQ